MFGSWGASAGPKMAIMTSRSSTKALTTAALLCANLETDFPTPFQVFGSDRDNSSIPFFETDLKSIEGLPE